MCFFNLIGWKSPSAEWRESAGLINLLLDIYYREGQVEVAGFLQFLTSAVIREGKSTIEGDETIMSDQWNHTGRIQNGDIIPSSF